MSARTSSLCAIDGQLTPNNVLNGALLDVFESVERGEFVPDCYKNCAYTDQSIPLVQGRCILPPLVQAFLLNAADVSAEHSVLCVAGVKGYTAALLARMGAAVHMVEELTDCAEKARRYFSANRDLHVEVFTGSLVAGHPEGAPYDRIIVEGAIDRLPEALIEQLAEGGVCVAIERSAGIAAQPSDLGCVVSYVKKGDQLIAQRHQEVFAPILPGFEKQEGFVL